VLALALLLLRLSGLSSAAGEREQQHSSASPRRNERCCRHLGIWCGPSGSVSVRSVSMAAVRSVSRAFVRGVHRGHVQA
jgi:hypothetical protein